MHVMIYIHHATMPVSFSRSRSVPSALCEPLFSESSTSSLHRYPTRLHASSATRPTLPACLRTAGILSHVHTKRVCRAGSARFVAIWDQAIRRHAKDANANHANASFQKNARGRGKMRPPGEVLRATLASRSHTLATMATRPRI